MRSAQIIGSASDVMCVIYAVELKAPARYPLLGAPWRPPRGATSAVWLRFHMRHGIATSSVHLGIFSVVARSCTQNASLSERKLIPEVDEQAVGWPQRAAHRQTAGNDSKVIGRKCKWMANGWPEPVVGRRANGVCGGQLAGGRYLDGRMVRHRHNGKARRPMAAQLTNPRWPGENRNCASVKIVCCSYLKCSHCFFSGGRQAILQGRVRRSPITLDRPNPRSRCPTLADHTRSVSPSAPSSNSVASLSPSSMASSTSIFLSRSA